MKVQLPNSDKIELDTNISLKEKMEVVKQLTEEWMSVITQNWNDNKVKYFLDTLTNYLVWHKDGRQNGQKGNEDKYVLSKKKVDKLSNHRKDSKTINFSDLPCEIKEILFGERGNQ